MRKRSKKSTKRVKKGRGSNLGRFFLSRLIILAVVIIPLIIFTHYYKYDPFKVVAKRVVVATAYSSSVDQTDDTPCITANGFNVCDNGIEEVIANNGLKFGTKIRIPALYGDRIFTVHDRMNSRYGGNRIDLWMTSRERAIDFGAKKVEIEIVEERES